MKEALFNKVYMITAIITYSLILMNINKIIIKFLIEIKQNIVIK